MEQSQPAARGQSLLEWYEALISAALVLVLVFSFFFRIIQVDGESMVPTLENGDKLIVWGAGYEPQRGDVVIVDSYTSYGRPLVKRVIGLPGDTVSIQNGYVYINGEKLEESYLPRQGVTAAGNQEEYVVPEGCLFFLGDNRTNSQDARLWDNPYIPVDKVRSHVLVCISFLKENSWRGIRVVS